MLNKKFLLLALLCALVLLPFLGLTEFNTRGEPREALVAQAMLAQDNWVLPVSNGVDMAYKPPMFHWCIALASVVSGAVTEYTSRLPSALALIAMVLCGYRFYARRRGEAVAWLMAAVTLTNFEVHRAGINCRVDMVLAAFMVLALYALYRWWEKGLRGVPLLAILCMSGAMLTKGPVGVILPAGAVALFCLLRGEGLWRCTWRFALVVLGALVLPAVWYVAAWRQGGDPFLQLVIEENVLRFLGKMSYESHENPAWYNVVMLVSGMLPYTLLGLFALVAVRWHRPALAWRTLWQRAVQRVRTMDAARLFSVVSFVVIFVFYCIPKSKRGVYLLPCYPFVAYFAAELIIYLVHHRPAPLRWYARVMAGLGVLLTGLFFFVLRLQLIPESLFTGKHAAENAAFVHALSVGSLGWGSALIALLPAAAGLWYFFGRGKSGKPYRPAVAALVAAFAIFFALDGVFLPRVLNVKSNRPVAQRIASIVPTDTIYSFAVNTVPGNRMHPFSVNFYTGGRVVPFEDIALPKGVTRGYLLVGERQIDAFHQLYGSRFTLTELYDSQHPSCDDKDILHLYRFAPRDVK